MSKLYYGPALDILVELPVGIGFSPAASGSETCLGSDWRDFGRAGALGPTDGRSHDFRLRRGSPRTATPDPNDPTTESPFQGGPSSHGRDSRYRRRRPWTWSGVSNISNSG